MAAAHRTGHQAFARENLVQGAADYPRWVQVERDLRDSLARLINAPSSRSIALIKSTSEALSFVAAGIDWRNGDNVVLARQEFPSNRYPWLALQSRGVEVRQVDLEAFATAEDGLFEQVDGRTRLLTCSAVQYANGMRMDLGRIGAFCRQRDILFCVDAIQQLGALPIDVQAIQADFLMADGHKWLLAPEGLGVFYCAEQHLEELSVSQFGWHMVEHPGDFESDDWRPAHSARRFECGSPNMLAIHALQASVSLLHDTGMDRVAATVLANADYLREQISGLGDFEIGSPEQPSRRSGILAFRHPGRDNEQLYQALMRQGVVCAYRHGHVRFSPHFYTRRQRLDAALERVEALTRN